MSTIENILFSLRSLRLLCISALIKLTPEQINQFSNYHIPQPGLQINIVILLNWHIATLMMGRAFSN